MNNIVEYYLLFKANNVCKYIEILAKDMRLLSKIPKQLNKLVYKYYDLFILSSGEIDYELLKTKTGLDDSKERLLLFYLLIEFDIASKTEYKNSKLYKIYNFIVNSIIIFSELEKEKAINTEKTYDNLISKIIKKYKDYIDDDYLLLLDNLLGLMNKEYNNSLKKELKFKELYYEQKVYDVSFSKIKESDDFYLSKFKYKNEKLNNESKKDVELINNEFLLQLNLVNIEILTMKVLENIFSCQGNKFFVKIEDDVLLKKSNLEILLSLVKLRCLKEKIVFIINTSILEKNEEKVTYLIQKNLQISYYKNNELVPYDVYKQGGYLFVCDNENIKRCQKFANANNLEVIVNKSNKKNDKLNNVMYVT